VQARPVSIAGTPTGGLRSQQGGCRRRLDAYGLGLPWPYRSMLRRPMPAAARRMSAWLNSGILLTVTDGANGGETPANAPTFQQLLHTKEVIEGPDHVRFRVRWTARASVAGSSGLWAGAACISVWARWLRQSERTWTVSVARIDSWGSVPLTEVQRPSRALAADVADELILQLLDTKPDPSPASCCQMV
jgi:hypothetical protein